ncbi:MAG: BREX system P-loop protein BrxC, partial [Bacillota bacterium]|nr:BREX system P-loop protein BrxC [Bacillota bacterium]
IAFFKDKTKTINILHGFSRQKRDFDIWDKETRPNTDVKLNIWIRDGWFENESIVLNEIRAEGVDAPLGYVFVKKFRDPELRSEIIKYLAAELTLNAKGLPSNPEGEQAKKSMETRKESAKQAIEELIIKICTEGLVYLAGGNKVETGNIRDNIENALNSIADRQFPEFKSKGDYKDWDKALTKALSGDPDALKRIGWEKEPKDHPVAVEILRFIGNNAKQGKEIRNNFMKAPYGWSQDAIDAMIVLLRNTEDISTPEPNINQAKIGNAVFKKEVHTLTASDKIQLRKLYQDAGISCKPGEEFLHSNAFLYKLKELAGIISGDAPKPEPINIQFVKNIENLDGNERLLRILEEQEDMKSKYTDWSKKQNLVIKREPQWRLLAELANHTNGDDGMDQLKKEIEAIRENRLILQEPDPIQPILIDLTEKLKAALNKLKENFISLYDQKMAELQTKVYFNKLSPEQKHNILFKHQLLLKPEIISLDAFALLNQLRKASLYTWNTKIAALPVQYQSALDDAIQLSAPQAKTYSLPRRTITNQAEIESYITELKTELENLLKDSSSIILK